MTNVHSTISVKTIVTGIVATTALFVYKEKIRMVINVMSPVLLKVRI